MKRIFLSVAILAVAASCSKNEVIDMPQSNQIGFATLNSNVTSRAANANALTAENKVAAAANNYKVYAVVTGTSSAWFMNGVEYTSADAAVVTANHYYWPSTGTLDFLAYAPSTTVTADATTKVGTLDLSYTVNATASEDFTVATPITGASVPATSTSDVTAAGKVNLKFNHMLSKATIDVKLDDAIKTVNTFTFTGIKFNVDVNKVDVSTADMTPSYGAVDAAAAATTVAYTYAIDGSTTKGIAFTGIQELMFAPQDGDNCSIVIEGVKIFNGEQEIYSGDLTYDLSSTNAFAANGAYKFGITINTTATNLVEITFASTMAAWDAGSNNDNDVALSTATQD